MSNLALIPARSGSKRIPNKNIVDFFGKPIIAYAIENAIKSNLFDEIIVSTDCERIAKIAENYGAKVPFLRSKENSEDHSTTYDVVHEVLNYYLKENYTFSYVCCIYPATPLLTSFQIKKGYEEIRKGIYDSVFPALQFEHPIERGFMINNNSIDFISRKNLLKNTQTLKTVYHDAGQYYWFEPTKLLKNKKLISENSKAIKVLPTHSHDIDTPIDLSLAKIKYKLLQNENKLL